MNKFLLATMALALASGSACAQLQMKQVAPIAKKSNLFPKGDLKLSDKVALVSSRQTRAGEEEGVPLDAKTLSNMGGWDRNVYLANMQGQNNLTLEIATFYDPVLLARFDGNKITKINTTIGPNMKNLKAFIMDAQTGDMLWEGKQLPSINNTTSKPKNVSFKCDYTIDKTKPIVVGYTITTKSSDVQIACVNNVVSNGLLLDIIGDEFEGYQDIGGASGVAAYIDCETEGGASLKNNDVVVVDLAGGRVPNDSEYNTVATFINYGLNPVTSLSTSYVVDEKDVKEDVSAGEQSFPYMAPVQLNLKGVSPKEAARYLQNFTITKVNGVDDEYLAEDVFSGKPDNLAQNLLTVISHSYPRTVVMEQFTGTWCGWCPRGHVAMEKASKKFPDKFIGIAVHAGDEMECQDYVPLLSMIGNFPSAMLNRIGYTIFDPYYGTQGPAQKPGDANGDVLNDIEAVSTLPVEAKVEISSKMNGSDIEVTSNLDFSLNADGQLYSMAYVLLENGIQGFLQSNYYNKDAGKIQSADQIVEDDLRFLFNEGRQGKYAPTFNYVARSIKDVAGIEGSLDNVAIKAGSPVTHTYSLAIPETVKDKNNLEIVALLFDNLTGEILNAKKAKIGETTAVERVHAEAATVDFVNGALSVKGNGTVSVYTVDGKLVKSESVNGSASVSTVGLKGAYIVRVVDGNNVTVKKVML